jgi:hypothetical protein
MNWVKINESASYIDVSDGPLNPDNYPGILQYTRDKEGIYCRVCRVHKHQSTGLYLPLILSAPNLLDACKGVLTALNEIDLAGQVAWITPPWQAPGVHESAQERLEAVIAEAEGKP